MPNKRAPETPLASVRGSADLLPAMSLALAAFPWICSSGGFTALSSLGSPCSLVPATQSVPSLPPHTAVMPKLLSTDAGSLMCHRPKLRGPRRSQACSLSPASTAHSLPAGASTWSATTSSMASGAPVRGPRSGMSKRDVMASIGSGGCRGPAASGTTANGMRLPSQPTRRRHHSDEVSCTNNPETLLQCSAAPASNRHGLPGKANSTVLASSKPGPEGRRATLSCARDPSRHGMDSVPPIVAAASSAGGHRGIAFGAVSPCRVSICMSLWSKEVVL
mmetsp:Transcript_45149/g.130727  ORF Transcript_45149/g.130727 Transcript_45149/m.130727 type:complete len:277 (-) Transcript_45149:2165-2995(-)